MMGDRIVLQCFWHTREDIVPGHGSLSLWVGSRRSKRQDSSQYLYGSGSTTALGAHSPCFFKMLWAFRSKYEYSFLYASVEFQPCSLTKARMVDESFPGRGAKVGQREQQQTIPGRHEAITHWWVASAKTSALLARMA